MLDNLINKKPLKIALVLSIITIVYNIVEGIVSVIFGINDQTLALLGFGVDSFVEVISGIGILHLIIRIKNSSPENRDKFESTALRITGFGFYILTAGLVAGSIINVIGNNNPSTTLVGIVVSVISIITMYLLMKAKFKVGEKLNSDAIIADAHCTKTCFNLSIILLLSSLLYEISSIGYFDILGSLGIAYYSFMEGKESFEKAENNKLSCTCS
ncbi:MAG: cation transporter [Ignavibacteriaceae bacterium]